MLSLPPSGVNSGDPAAVRFPAPIRAAHNFPRHHAPNLRRYEATHRRRPCPGETRNPALLTQILAHRPGSLVSSL